MNDTWERERLKLLAYLSEEIRGFLSSGSRKGHCRETSRGESKLGEVGSRGRGCTGVTNQD